MRYERHFLPLSILGAFGLVAAACSSGGGSSSSSDAPTNDCFAYGSFDAMSPAVTFSADVLPIFRRSCALSSACHGCDNASNPGCTNPGYKPFLGVPMMGTAPTAAQITAMLASMIGAPAILQTSLVDSTSMVGNPTMSIVKAGDPSNSFMTYKLDGNFPTVPTNQDVFCTTLACAGSKNCGEAMPNGGPALSTTDRDTIRRWIAQGAKNN